jgi:hypothetical protein
MYAKWICVMFPYGALRQWRSDIPPPHNVMGDRMLYSLCSGVLYSSPFGVMQLIRQLNRFDVEWSTYDKDKYIGEYNELFGVNKNTVL